MQKKSEYGLLWYSNKGPIHISKEGVMKPAFTNKSLRIQENEQETSLLGKKENEG